MKQSKSKSHSSPSVNKNANPRFVGKASVRKPVGGVATHGSPASRGGLKEDLGKR